LTDGFCFSSVVVKNQYGISVPEVRRQSVENLTGAIRAPVIHTAQTDVRGARKKGSEIINRDTARFAIAGSDIPNTGCTGVCVLHPVHLLNGMTEGRVGCSRRRLRSATPGVDAPRLSARLAVLALRLMIR
jgi:hypothetical protein